MFLDGQGSYIADEGQIVPFTEHLKEKKMLIKAVIALRLLHFLD